MVHAHVRLIYTTNLDSLSNPVFQSQAFHALTFAGRRFDCGSKLGFVEATLALALEREDMGAEVRAMAQRLLK